MNKAQCPNCQHVFSPTDTYKIRETPTLDMITTQVTCNNCKKSFTIYYTLASIKEN